MMSNCQHGFRQKRSCITQLLNVIEDFTRMIDDGKSIDVIYLDFRKAFDSVPHERLFRKIKSYGITGNLYNWIRCFLSDRKQRVIVNGEMSAFRNVISGVPQGSVLGPLLFILFVNDLPDTITSTCKLFADDTKIYKDSKQHLIIQEDINSLFQWSKKWQLEFNVDKCKVLHIGKYNPCHIYYTDNSYSESLTVSNSERDLGVVFDSFLNFDLHINGCISRANRVLGIIHRSFSYLDKRMFIPLYKTIIRPILEYGNSIWSPLYKRQSISIENVQRRATRTLYGLKYLSYEQRLVLLDLPSLKYRRLRGDLIQLYKIVHNVNDLDQSDFFYVFHNYIYQG